MGSTCYWASSFFFLHTFFSSRAPLLLSLATAFYLPAKRTTVQLPSHPHPAPGCRAFPWMKAAA